MRLFCLAVGAWLVVGCQLDRTGMFGRDASSPQIDAGTADAGPGTVADAAHTPDAGPACFDEEVCGGGDEDCDGTVDEGCAWHFGRPSPLVHLHRSADYHYSPVLSADGRRLYYRGPALDGTDLWVAERAGVEDRFGTPSPVPGEDFAAYDLYSFTLSDDELEMIAEGRPTGSDVEARLYRATRTASTEPFGTLAPVEGIAPEVGIDFNPHLSRDGRELLFATTRAAPAEIWRAVREASGEPFSEPAPISFDTAEAIHAVTPMLSPDGHTLFFAAQGRIHRAERDDTTTGIFGAPEVLAELESPDPSAPTYFPFVSQWTAELFFISERAWSPATSSIWRARICRDGPCGEEEIPCETGVRSPDGRRCYVLGEPALDWAESRDGCRTNGAELVTIHSDAERELVSSLISNAGHTNAWVGGHDQDAECNLDVPGCTFSWITGEPFLPVAWAVGQPNDNEGGQDCLKLEAPVGVFDDGFCSITYARVCEHELWPW